MALRISKKTGLILGIVMAVLMVGAGGYLLWRTNQEEYISATDTDAGYYVCSNLHNELSCKSVGCIWNETSSTCKSYDKSDSQTTSTSAGGNVACDNACTSDNDCAGDLVCSNDGVCRRNCPSGYSSNNTCTDCIKKITTVTATSTCGDNTCDSDENANTCPNDCPASCGDNYCTHDETADTCPEDCSATCGDNYCTHDETANTCPDDCESICGDGYCTHDEDASTCPEDCDAECGDGICTADSENANTCPDDCGATCGDGYCTHDETEESCPDDCGEDVITEYPDTGLFDNVSNSIKLGLGFISLGFITTQANKVVTAYDVVLQNREIKIRKKRRSKIERKIYENS